MITPPIDRTISCLTSLIRWFVYLQLIPQMVQLGNYPVDSEGIMVEITSIYGIYWMFHYYMNGVDIEGPGSYSID
jgi:hypothetical protein